MRIMAVDYGDATPVWHSLTPLVFLLVQQPPYTAEKQR